MVGKKRQNMAAHLMEAFKMQCDDRRQRGYQHLLPSAGVNLLHLLIYVENKKHTEILDLTVKILLLVYSN